MFRSLSYRVVCAVALFVFTPSASSLAYSAGVDGRADIGCASCHSGVGDVPRGSRAVRGHQLGHQQPSQADEAAGHQCVVHRVREQRQGLLRPGSHGVSLPHPVSPGEVACPTP